MRTTGIAHLARVAVLTVCGFVLGCDGFVYEDGYGPDGRLSHIAATIDVSGTWMDTAGDDSTTTIVLSQSGDDVTGTFTDEDGWSGTIKGSVSGDRVDLTYTYTDGYVVFNSAAAEDNSLTGTFWSADGSITGTWTATKVADPAPDVSPLVPTDPEPVAAGPRSSIRHYARSSFTWVLATNSDDEYEDVTWDVDGNGTADFLFFLPSHYSMTSNTHEAMFQTLGSTRATGPIDKGADVSAASPVWPDPGVVLLHHDRSVDAGTWTDHITGETRWAVTYRHHFSGLWDTSLETVYASPTGYLMRAESYIGIEFAIDGDLHYGWGRLVRNHHNPYDDTMTLHEWAYETRPGVAIKAGERR